MNMNSITTHDTMKKNCSGDRLHYNEIKSYQHNNDSMMCPIRYAQCALVETILFYFE